MPQHPNSAVDNNIAFFRGGKAVTYKQRRDELAAQRKISVKPSGPGKTTSMLALVDQVAKETDADLKSYRRQIDGEWIESKKEQARRVALEKKFPRTRKGLLKMLEADDSVLPSSPDSIK